MYNSAEIVERIKDRTAQRDKSVGEMLSACGLGINTISKMVKGTDILTKNFAKIADCLDCSVDYLLGRTEFAKLSPEGFSESELLLIAQFRQFNQEGQKQLLNVTDDMIITGKYKKSNLDAVGTRGA